MNSDQSGVEQLSKKLWNAICFVVLVLLARSVILVANEVRVVTFRISRKPGFPESQSGPDCRF